MKFSVDAASWMLKRQVGWGTTWVSPLTKRFYIAFITISMVVGQGAIALVSAQQPPQPSPSASVTSTEALEQAIHTQINQHRRDQGLPPLTLDPRMSEQARSHSQAMAAGRVAFGHDGFNQRGTVINRAIAWNSIAENVATNQGFGDPGRQAVVGWLNSQGHRQNIEGQYNLTGIGVARNSQGQYYFTQIFVRSRRN
ncbi:MAG: CAP domain-containing protein [Oculatellaceae cyanobacterium bins.114]|nr:CAP domain-containing protein [Oculatellaceae cyanobacterium bins.114]